MQTLVAQLSQIIDENDFRKVWKVEAEPGSPEIEFDFADNVCAIKIYTAPNAPWGEGNFKQAFALALHKIAPQCDITWQ